MTEERIMYMVMVVKKTVDVKESLTNTTTTVPLVTAKGMVGAIPVFDSVENADKYNQGRSDIVAIELKKELNKVQQLF